MPINPPLRASGSRELKRPRPIPRPVRNAITLMVYGKSDDSDCAPLSFIEAAKIVGLKPDQMRRWLDRAEVRTLLRTERRAFRDAICAGNEQALRKVRDTSANGMSVVASVRALEDLSEAEVVQSRNQGQTPGVVIVIHPPSFTPAPASIPTLDAQPIEPELPTQVDRSFDPYRGP